MTIKVHYSPRIKTVAHDTINLDLLKELHGLRKALNNNADKEMQKIYPEGYVFFNALYGLAWCNFIRSNPSFFNEGHAELQKAWNNINSDLGRSTFDEHLPLSYGAFYTGWSTYLLGRKLSIEDKSKWNSEEVSLFKEQCERIYTSIDKTTYPESYRGSAWPGDVIVCVAALALHAKLFQANYSESIKKWIQHVKTNLDPNGLIPHSVNLITVKQTEPARGSSQSLMLIFLREIDETFANQQFKKYKSLFLDKGLGLTGIREYPKGHHGIGDIDSGTVIFQMGSAATIVGMQTMHLFGEQQVAAEIRNTIEAIGFPFQNDESKVYLFGVLPMADAFIAWGHSAMSLESIAPNFTSFHVYSAIAVLILLFALWFVARRTFKA
jgi:hypothetical protein